MFPTKTPPEPRKKRNYTKRKPFLGESSFALDQPLPYRPQVNYVDPFTSECPISGFEEGVSNEYGMDIEHDNSGGLAQTRHVEPEATPSTSPPDSLTIIQYIQPSDIPEISKWQRVDNVLAAILDNFDNLGDFLAALFESLPRDDPEKQFITARHCQMVQYFLQGRYAVTAVMVVVAIYNHRYSYLTSRAKDELWRERHDAFSSTADETKAHYARIATSIWAVKLVGSHVFKEMHVMSRGVPSQPKFPVHLSSSELADPDTSLPLFRDFSLIKHAEMYKESLPLTWYLTECMARPKLRGNKDSLVVMRKSRPHPIIQVIAISAGLLSRNRLATGFMALQMGVWLFSTKAHVDINSTSHKTGDIGWRVIVDNEQQYVRVREEGHCKENELRVGCGATAVKLENFKPGAFRIEPLIDACIHNRGSNLTVEDIRQDIDTKHLRNVGMLHIICILVGFEPSLQHLKLEVTQCFRMSPVAKHHMPDGWKTEIQPLGCNSEREVEMQGILWAVHNFARGDGATYAAMRRAQDFLSPNPSNNLETFGGVIPTIEICHTRATMLNTLATNHYGPENSKDPSSLSQNANATGMKRPTDTRSCDFYPMSCSMSLFWEAIRLANHGDLHAYFMTLATQNKLPTFDELLAHAQAIYDCYMTNNTYQQALSSVWMESSKEEMKIPNGKPWEAKEKVSELVGR
ncbi:hypothetical protein PM082_012329 [Marasmius tenuissimus]|nr:hypothetical protein PM082_012329 [Marasmius tenuissimus]